MTLLVSLVTRTLKNAFTHFAKEPISWDYVVGCTTLKHTLDCRVNEEEVVVLVSLPFMHFTLMEMYLCRRIMPTYMLPVLLNKHYKIFDNFLSCHDCQIIHELDMIICVREDVFL